MCNLWTRSPTLQAACRSSSASSGSRSWYCGNWLFSADASLSSHLRLWVWSATEVRDICSHFIFKGIASCFEGISYPPVYCCCCLANISIPGIGMAVPEFRPFFYVNVADISALENELSYVACKLLLENPTEKKGASWSDANL